MVLIDALARNDSLFLQAAKQFTGFESWLDSGAYYDTHTTTSFTLYRGGTGYIKNAPVIWAGNQTITGLTPGNTYFVYIDKAGTIGMQVGESGAMLANTIVLFTVLCEAAGKLIVTVDNYSYGIPYTVLDYLHEVVGTVIINENDGANQPPVVQLVFPFDNMITGMTDIGFIFFADDDNNMWLDCTLYNNIKII